MDLRSRIQRQLKKVREVSEAFFSSFQSLEQWTLQVHDKANHALWVAGHLGTVDNFLISLVAPDKAVMKEGYAEKFGMGSRPTSDPADYPDPAEVLDFMRERRQALLELLGGLSDEDLSRPAPQNAPEITPDVGSMFELAVWHEALHAGQVTIARRSLGFAPLADAPPPGSE
jgi:hypothetical protein